MAGRDKYLRSDGQVKMCEAGLGFDFGLGCRGFGWSHQIQIVVEEGGGEGADQTRWPLPGINEFLPEGSR
jgi:hypothetical protein